jgi:hypothetical protein
MTRIAPDAALLATAFALRYRFRPARRYHRSATVVLTASMNVRCETETAKR